jgi:hypothetical protein
MSRATVRPANRPGSLTFDYRLGEQVALAEEGWSRHVERWNVTVAAEGGAVVGYAQVIILNLDGGVEVADLTDAASGDWREPIARAARDLAPASVGANEAVGAREAGALGAHVLVLDRVFIEPDYRGSGLGPIVAALVIGRLQRGCRFAVCFPAPFDGARPDEERDRSIAALGRVWATVGFQARPDGMWVLDLQGDTLRLATERLLDPGSDPTTSG